MNANNKNNENDTNGGILEKQINDILPNQTLYLSNLNERVKIEGMSIGEFFRIKDVIVSYLLTVWRNIGNTRQKKFQTKRSSIYSFQRPKLSNYC